MICHIEGCERESMYKAARLCQKHYFRIMRNGTAELVRSRRYRRTHTSGYQLIYEPDHELSQDCGYIYEHRFVMFNAWGERLKSCALCGREWSWSATYKSHIDHIDKDKSNNNLSNLRPLCNSCNTSRPGVRHDAHTVKGRSSITYMGRTMTAAEWAREEGSSVTGKTILSRIGAGWEAGEAMTTPSRTLKSKAIKAKYKTKANEQAKIAAN